MDYQNYTTEAEEYADLVADNRIAELAAHAFGSASGLYSAIFVPSLQIFENGLPDPVLELLVCMRQQSGSMNGNAAGKSPGRSGSPWRGSP